MEEKIMSMMQSYYQKSFNEVTNTFLINLSDVILELEYAELRSVLQLDKDRLRNIREKIKYILYTLKESKTSLVINSLTSDYQYLSLVNSFNEFFSREFKIDDLEFAIYGEIESQLEDHISNIEKRLKELERNTIFDPLIPYDLISPNKELQKFLNSKKEEFSSKSESKKPVISPNKEETKSTEFQSVDFGDDMPKQMRNFHILYKKFKSYYTKYITTGEDSSNKFKNKYLKRNSCTLLCLDMIITNEISNANVIIFYTKNHSLVQKFINMYPHLEKLVTSLEKSENTEKLKSIEEIKKYLNKMFYVIKKMKLNELKISTF